MNTGLIVDAAIVILVATMTAVGFRGGLLRAGSSLIGLALGLVVAVPLASHIGQQISDVGPRLGVVVATIVLLANIGYVGGMLLGERMRRRVRRPLAVGLDRGAGAVTSALISVLVLWMIALPLAASPSPEVARAIRASSVLPLIDSVMPDGARAAYDAIDAAIADQGLPDVLGPLDRTDVADVPPPSGEAANDPEVQAASASVVKVLGDASRCGQQIAGSGFVYAPGRVATNAHVVAGTSAVLVQLDGQGYEATVVYSDEAIDVAVLKVDGLQAPALPVQQEAPETGSDVVVAGYPGGGDKTLGAAKVRTTGNITGPTFRETSTVTREVVALRGTVVGGNSGGPLLDLDGDVVGLIFAAAVDEEEVGYALTIDQIDDALEAGASRDAAVVTGACYQ